MTKYVVYNPDTAQVIDWLDTEAFSYVLPTTVMLVSDKQFSLQGQPCWVNLDENKLILTPPPGDYYRLAGGKWVLDQTAFDVALLEARRQKTESIKAFRDAMMADYVVIGGYQFQSDSASRIQQMTLTQMAQSGTLPDNLQWQTKNSGVITLTNEMALQFVTLTIAHDMRIFATALAHIGAVEALTEPGAITDYDFSQGWEP